MKVKFEIDPDAPEAEIVIRAKDISPEIKQLYQKLQAQDQHADQIEGIRDDMSYYLRLSDILFFETKSWHILRGTLIW